MPDENGKSLCRVEGEESESASINVISIYKASHLVRYFGRFAFSAQAETGNVITESVISLKEAKILHQLLRFRGTVCLNAHTFG